MGHTPAAGRLSDKGNSPKCLHESKTQPFFKKILRCNSHTIKFTIIKCTIRWLSVYLQGCTTVPTVLQNLFITRKRNPIDSSSHSPVPSPLSPWHPLICDLSLWICPSRIFHLNGKRLSSLPGHRFQVEPKRGTKRAMWPHILFEMRIYRPSVLHIQEPRFPYGAMSYSSLKPLKVLPRTSPLPTSPPRFQSKQNKTKPKSGGATALDE